MKANVFKTLKNMGLVYGNDETPETESKDQSNEKTNKPVTEKTSKRPVLFVPTENPVTPGQIVGEISEEIYQKLNDAIEKANLPGNDFYEFMVALQNIQSMAADEKTKFGMVFMTLNSSDKMSKDKLLSSVDHYLTVIDKEKTTFGKQMENALQQMVTVKENEAVSISETIKQKMELIEKTKDEIDFIIDALQQRWVDAVQKLAGKELGDIERQNYEYAKHKSKELMGKLGSE